MTSNITDHLTPCILLLVTCALSFPPKQNKYISARTQNFKAENFKIISAKVGGTLLVAQLIEALRYKPEGRGFDSQWCHWNFPLI